MRINYQSDFKLNEAYKVTDTIDLTTPFKFTYYTSVRSSFVASFDGQEYTNCKRAEDSSLMVIFDTHKLNSGNLMVRREYFLTDEDFSNNICCKVSVEDTGVTLSDSVDDGDVADIVVYPNYQKGDKGDKGDSGTTELMSFEIKEDGYLYVNLPEDSNVSFNINENGELVAQW